MKMPPFYQRRKDPFKELMERPVSQIVTSRTVHLYDEESRDVVLARVEQEMREGETLYQEDGSVVYYDDQPYYEYGDYLWDRNFERAKHARYRVTVQKNGVRVSEFVRHIYKAP